MLCTAFDVLIVIIVTRPIEIFQNGTFSTAAVQKVRRPSIFGVLNDALVLFGLEGKEFVRMPALHFGSGWQDKDPIFGKTRAQKRINLVED